MDEKEKKEVNEAEKQPAKNIMDPEEQLRQFSQGRMELTTPIEDGGNIVKELKWDFMALTGAEYCDALDRDTRAVNTFRLTNTQALNLFAAAAAKATGGLDAEDVRRGLSVRDTIKAAQLATIFFSASNRLGNLRIFGK